MKYEVGSTAFIVENNKVASEVTIVNRKGSFYTVRLKNSVFTLKEHRIFPSREAAEKSMYHRKDEKKTGYRSPYDYN